MRKYKANINRPVNDTFLHIPSVFPSNFFFTVILKIKNNKNNMIYGAYCKTSQ